MCSVLYCHPWKRPAFLEPTHKEVCGRGNVAVCNSEALWFQSKQAKSENIFLETLLGGVGSVNLLQCLLVDMNITVRGTLAFLANLWTMEGHLETLPTLSLPASGLSLGHLLEMDHLWQKFD